MGRRDLVFKAQRKEKSAVLKPKVKHVTEKVDPLKKLKKRGLRPLREFFEKDLFEREERYQDPIGGDPKYLFHLQNNEEYSLLAKFIQLLRQPELRAFFILLATCNGHSCEYILNN